MPYLARPVRAVRIIKSRAPIVEAIKTVAARLGATEEEAWRAIKSQCAAGLLILEGIDGKGRPRTVERHWIIYIEKFGRDLPSSAHFESDMPDRDGGSMVAFDRHRAQRDRLSDEADGAQPRSLPPRRLRDLVADGAQLDKLWYQAERDLKTEDVAARRHDAETTGAGDLIPLNAAIEKYPENRATKMRMIESAWQSGRITLWGRRKGHAMPEPIQQHRGLVIEWHAGAPKGGYYAEAYAHPAEFGAGYHRHEWEDLAILSVDLERLIDSPEAQIALRREDIAQATKAHEVVFGTNGAEAALRAEGAPILSSANNRVAETPATTAARRRLRYKAALAEWMARKGTKLLVRMTPEGIAAGFRNYCETDRQDLLPLPSRLRSMEGTVVKILDGMKEAAEAADAKTTSK